MSATLDPQFSPKRRGRPCAWDEEKATRFLTILAQCGTLRAACAASGWCEDLVQIWRREKLRGGAPNPRYRPHFAAGVAEALAAFRQARVQRMLSALQY